MAHPRLLDGRTGRTMAVLREHRGVAGGAFARAGDRFALIDEFGTARVWDRRGALLGALRGPGAATVTAAFSASGAYLATVDTAGGVHAWRARDLRHLATLGASNVAAAQRIGWAGSSVVVASTTDLIRIFPCEVCRPIDALLRLARSRVARQLTPAERRRFLHER